MKELDLKGKLYHFLKGTQVFPLGDRAPREIRKQSAFSETVLNPPDIQAVWTGEKRCPKKGEWYLSGGKITAYLAPSDLSTPYHIAKLVKVEKIEKIKIIELK